MSDRINFEITKHYGVIAENPKTGWKREVNEVSWNGGKPKVDIREWDPEHVKMSRGCTFTKDEAVELQRILNQMYPPH